MCKLDDSMAITGKNSVDECIAREGRPVAHTPDGQFYGNYHLSLQ